MCPRRCVAVIQQARIESKSDCLAGRLSWGFTDVPKKRCANYCLRACMWAHFQHTPYPFWLAGRARAALWHRRPQPAGGSGGPQPPRVCRAAVKQWAHVAAMQ